MFQMEKETEKRKKKSKKKGDKRTNKQKKMRMNFEAKYMYYEKTLLTDLIAKRKCRKRK